MCLTQTQLVGQSSLGEYDRENLIRITHLRDLVCTLYIRLNTKHVQTSTFSHHLLCYFEHGVWGYTEHMFSL